MEGEARALPRAAAAAAAGAAAAALPGRCAAERGTGEGTAWGDLLAPTEPLAPRGVQRRDVARLHASPLPPLPLIHANYSWWITVRLHLGSGFSTSDQVASFVKSSSACARRNGWQLTQAGRRPAAQMAALLHYSTQLLMIFTGLICSGLETVVSKCLVCASDHCFGEVLTEDEWTAVKN